MPKTLTARQAQRLDHHVIYKIGIPSCILMENAGRQAAEEICSFAGAKKRFSACIVCGCGNNGGDGFVAARYLLQKGKNVHVVVVGSARDLKPDPHRNYQILKKLQCPIRFIQRADAKLFCDLHRADILVDAIFGIGLSRAIEGRLSTIVAVLNQARKPIVSLDVPSGLCATTGKAQGACIRAALTVTFFAAKKGFLTSAGKQLAGQVKVVDIGVPSKIIQRFTSV